MLFLNADDDKKKKEQLSKRTAVFIADAQNIFTAYSRMKELYKYRSEFVHEGNSNNINPVVVDELEEICRTAIKKALVAFDSSIVQNSNVTYVDWKNTVRTDLINKVQAEITTGVLPV